MAPPLTLEQYNRIVKDTVLSQITSEKPEGLDITVCDYNQTSWHISSGNGTLTVSVSASCWESLSKNGGTEHIKKIYGAMLVKPEPKFDVTLSIKLGAPAVKDPKEAEILASKVSRLYRNMMAGPFLMMFNRASERYSGPDAEKVIQLDYRPNESIWLKQEGDRVIAIFSIYFDDPDDVVIGRVFLTEAGKMVQGAPSVDIHLKDPPKELQGIRGLRAHGYVSFLLEARHFAPKQRDATIDVLMQFRNYMHYHIKCSKAYLHIRMRTRVNLLLQVLNRAKQETKPAAGETKKTFSRRV